MLPHSYSVKPYTAAILALIVLCACSGHEKSEYARLRKRNEHSEAIAREHDDKLFVTPPLVQVERAKYPWEQAHVGAYPRITREHFRCRGSNLNPLSIVGEDSDAPRHFLDCGGSQRHSLPIVEGHEFVQPVLLEILNYIQKETGQRVVITCGHRCPQHNAYADPSSFNLYSKHQTGAEADFYVEGMEDQPEKIVALIQKFYRDSPRYRGIKAFEHFKRYSKDNSNVAIRPWHNKEVFVKLYQPEEGRDFDNRHKLPYIGVLVLWDRDKEEKVRYSSDQAQHGYHRR